MRYAVCHRMTSPQRRGRPQKAGKRRMRGEKRRWWTQEKGERRRDSDAERRPGHAGTKNAGYAEL